MAAILCAFASVGCDLDRTLNGESFACGFGGACDAADASAALDEGPRDLGDGAVVHPDAEEPDAGLDAMVVDVGEAGVRMDAEVDAGRSDGGGDAGVCDAATYDCLQTACCPNGFECESEVCVDDMDPWRCTECDNRRGACGGGTNLCLTNASYDPMDPTKGPQFYCADDCSASGECPNGYTCGQVRLAVGEFCENDTECPGTCVKDPGDTRGVCSCMSPRDCQLDSLAPACLGSCNGSGLLDCRTDADCAVGTCDVTPLRCQWPTNQVCNSDFDCERTPLCQDFGGQLRCITDLTNCTDGRDCRCRDGLCIGSRRGCRMASECDVPCVSGVCEVGHSCSPQAGLTCADL